MKRHVSICLVILFLELLSCRTSFAAISFIEPQSLPLTFLKDGSVTGLAKGDFNGDGKLDVAATYSDGGIGYVGVFHGEGNGQFKSPIKIQLPAGAHNTTGVGIAARDFDGDGRLDLAVSAADNSGLNRILFFEGRGDGTFSPFKAAALSSSGSPTILQSEDLDGNGTPDLVILNSGGNAVSVLLGNGGGTFAPPVDYPVGTNPADVAVSDINGDGRPDVFTGSFNDMNFTVLMNQGDGSFNSSQFSAGMQVTGIFMGDFNKDGKIDVMAAGVSPTVANANCYTDCLLFLPGRGDGSFDPPLAENFSDAGPGPHANLNQKGPLDIDGDGNPDLIFPLYSHYNGGSNQVFAGLGKGDGSFTKKMWVASPGTTGWNSAHVDGGNPSAAEWGDFNGDGALDLVVAEGSNNTRNGGLSFLTGKGNGDFRAPRVYRLGRPLSTDTRNLAVGDFDNDGKTDFVLITDALDFVKGMGDGTFSTSDIYSSTAALGHIGGPGEFYNTIRTADFDQDGKLDVIFLATGGVQGGPKPRNIAAFGNGDGTFQNPDIFSNYNPAVDPDAGGANVVTTDFNNDGYTDIAIWVYRTGDYTHVLGHIEAYLYEPAQRNFVRTAGLPEMDLGLLSLYPGHALAAGDFNKDGKADLIAHSTASYPDAVAPERLIFFSGKGDGTFSGPVSAGYGLPTINDFYAADVDADGDLDLLGAGGNGAYALLGNGDGTFDPAVFYDAGAGAGSVKAVDFDGNGTKDLAVSSGKSFTVFSGNGDGTFGPVQKFAIGDPGAYFFETAYLNQDGRVDVITLHHGDADSTITPLINDSGPRADLSVTASRTPAKSELGQEVTHTIKIKNKGPESASDIIASLWVSGNGNLTSITPTKGTCSGTQSAVCTIGNMASGASAYIKVVLTPDGVRPLLLTTNSYSSTEDPNLADNGSSLSTTVLHVLPPSSLTATAASSKRIDLSWKERSDNETGFRIERKTGEGGTYARVTTLGAGVTSFSDTGLTPDTTYYYRVKGVGVGGNSPYSNEADAVTLRQHTLAVAKDGTGNGKVSASPSGINCGTTCSRMYDEGVQVTLTATAYAGSAFTGWSGGGCTGTGTCTIMMAADTTVTATFGRLPLPPSSLTAGAVSSTRIDLSWTDNSNNEDGFIIYRKDAGGTYSIASVGPDIKLYSDTNLTPGTAYLYVVAAYNAAGNSSQSNEAGAATLARYFFSISKILLVPSGGTVTSSPAAIDCGPTCWAFFDQGTVVTLTATPDPGSGFAGWSGGGCTGKGKCSVTVTSDKMVVAASFGPLPSAPSSLSATAVSSSRIDLSWKDNSDNETGFRVERKTGAGGSYSLIGTVSTGATAYSDTGRAPGTRYYYRVRAYNTFGNSAYSNETNATTLP